MQSEKTPAAFARDQFLNFLNDVYLPNYRWSWWSGDAQLAKTDTTPSLASFDHTLTTLPVDAQQQVDEFEAKNAFLQFFIWFFNIGNVIFFRHVLTVQRMQTELARLTDDATYTDMEALCRDNDFAKGVAGRSSELSKKYQSMLKDAAKIRSPRPYSAPPTASPPTTDCNKENVMLLLTREVRENLIILGFSVPDGSQNFGLSISTLTHYYWAAMKRDHSDRHAGASAEQKRVQDDKAAQINNARAVLLTKLKEAAAGNDELQAAIQGEIDAYDRVARANHELAEHLHNSSELSLQAIEHSRAATAASNEAAEASGRSCEILQQTNTATSIAIEQLGPRISRLQEQSRKARDDAQNLWREQNAIAKRLGLE